MKDFVLAALPWVLAGLSVAVCAASMSKQSADEAPPAGPNRTGLGMSLGAAAGAVAGLLGLVPLQYGLSFGMLLGVTAGCVWQGRK